MTAGVRDLTTACGRRREWKRRSSIAPLADSAFDRRLAEGFDEARRRYETDKQVAKTRRDLWEREVHAALKNQDAVAPRMPDEAVVPDEPVRPRIRVADSTTERLGSLAACLPRGLLLVRDEVSGFFASFDRYSRGGGDRAFALEMYGGRSYVVDRQKSPEPVRIRHLTVGVLGGIQPEKLPGLMDTPDDGLISRFLWAWPDALPGFKLSRRPIDNTAARDAFNRLASLKMATDEAGLPRPQRVPLTAEAENALEQFGQELEARAKDAVGLMAGAIGKARGHCLRLSCILEHLHWSGGPRTAEPKSVSAESVERAAGLVDGYFLPMAELVFGDAVLPASERRAMALAKHLRRSRGQRFNARELRRQLGGEFREAAMMDEACATLVEAGLIRSVRSTDGTGRKPKDFEVHPFVSGVAA